MSKVKELRTKIQECIDLLDEVAEEETDHFNLKEADDRLVLAYWNIDEIIRPIIYDEETDASYILEEDGTRTLREEWVR